MAKSKQKLKPQSKLSFPSLVRYDRINEEFLQRQEQQAKNFARWELNFLWTKFRQITVKELFALDIYSLPVNEAIVINALRHIIETKSTDLSELNKLYDRILGKPKEYREEKLIDDVEFTIDILPNPNESNPVDTNEA